MSASKESIISLYAPTLCADCHIKDKFYVRLLATPLPKHSMVIIGGDWNAQVDYNAVEWTRWLALRNMALRKPLRQWKMLSSFRRKAWSFVTNICFWHRWRHLFMWNSPDNQQIDYILARHRWKSWAVEFLSSAKTGNLWYISLFAVDGMDQKRKGSRPGLTA